MATLKNTTIDDTGFITLPSGTTAQRPASPVVGMYRYNTDLGRTEWWNGTIWQVIGSIKATGGTETTSGAYKIHKFTSSGTLTVTGSGWIEALLVAGGGGGGNDVAGGGGGGGVIHRYNIYIVNGSYSIVVGAGGSNADPGNNGSNTTAFGLTAFGGGGGGGGSGGPGRNGGFFATGKPSVHIPTNGQCSSCHSQSSWIPATNPHLNVVPGSCGNCHNGTKAKGKNATHIPVTGTGCDSCHNNFNAFAPAVMNHTGLTKCSSCHSGTYVAQNAQAKNPLTHISTSEQCSVCHSSTSTWIS